MNPSARLEDHFIDGRLVLDDHRRKVFAYWTVGNTSGKGNIGEDVAGPQSPTIDILWVRRCIHYISEIIDAHTCVALVRTGEDESKGHGAGERVSHREASLLDGGYGGVPGYVWVEEDCMARAVVVGYTVVYDAHCRLERRVGI